MRAAILGPEIAALHAQRTRINELHQQQTRASVALGTLMAHQIAGHAETCNEAEFRVFSQFGEDGIIEYLIRRCDIGPTTFVEIGVETYAEANTRFLAEHRLWRGLIIDQNPHLERDLAKTGLNWRAQVRAVTAFVTRENIAAIVDPFVGTGGLGLLSVDVDGVDYWLLAPLLRFLPAIVVVEYNGLFGDAVPVSVPYDPTFDRRRPEYHNIYYGASLGALEHVLGAAGYTLVACGSSGNNAFFVRSDRLGDVPARSISEAYRVRRFAEHRAADGALSGITDVRRQLEEVKHLPLIRVTDGTSLSVGDLL